MNGTTKANMTHELTAMQPSSISPNGVMTGNQSVSIPHGAALDPFAYDFPLTGATGGDLGALIVGAAKGGSVAPESGGSPSSFSLVSAGSPVHCLTGYEKLTLKKRDILDAEAGPVARKVARALEIANAEWDEIDHQQARHLSLISLASEQCARCAGRGTSHGIVCGCCYRKVFREVYLRYSLAVSISRSPRIAMGGTFNNIYPCRPLENFIADVENTARHSLPAQLHRIFTLHMLERLDWRETLIALKIDPNKKERGIFFHQVYAMTTQLGRSWRALKPYPLHPLDEYFSPVDGKGLVARPEHVPHKFKLAIPLRVAV